MSPARFLWQGCKHVQMGVRNENDKVDVRGST